MRGRGKQWIGFFIMLIGVIFLAGPFVLGFFGEARQEQIVNQFYEEKSRIREQGTETGEAEDKITGTRQQEDMEGTEKTSEMSETSETIETTETTATSPDPEIYDATTAVHLETMDPERADAFYRAACSYNDSLLMEGAQDMEDLAAVEQFALDATDYGFAENMIGVLKVPRLGVELGIYLGSDYDHMAKGVAVFGKTSIPLGRLNENTAISGHRGWRGTEVFRNIQLLQEGDPIYITTPWNVLCYRVSELRIVTPEDNSWCKIREGRSLVTLMTCHPYGNNYQRYIVFAEFTGEGMPSEEEIERENEETYDPLPRKVVEVKENRTTEIVEVSPEKVEADGSEYGSVYSNTVIVAENRMKPVAILLSVFVLGSGFVLLGATIRDMKTEREKKDGSV